MRYYLILAFLFLIGCNRPTNQDILIEDAFDFIFDLYLPELCGVDFTVSDRFTIEINERFIHQDLDMHASWLDSLGFNIDDIAIMNGAYKGSPLTKYVDIDKHKYLVPDDSISIKNTHFFFSVPIFNEDRSMFFQYMLVEIRKSDGWNHQYNVFEINDGKWDQEAVIKIQRDSIVNTID